MPEDFELDTTADLLLTMEIYKSMPDEDKDKFIKSIDGQIFFKKIRFSSFYKALPSTTARLIDMLAGTENTGYYGREGKLDGAPADPEPQIFGDKRLSPNQVESMIQASVSDPQDYWIKASELARVFKASTESIDAALKDGQDDGRIVKGMLGNEIVYANC
jgi:hypothetical protein